MGCSSAERGKESAVHAPSGAGQGGGGATALTFDAGGTQMNDEAGAGTVGGASGRQGGASGTLQGGVGGTTQGGASGAGGSAAQTCLWGDQLEHDTTLGHGTTLRICVASGSTGYRRLFSVTTPDTPLGGGYVVVSLHDVSPKVEVDIRITPANRDFPLDTFMHAAALGGDFDTWFAAQPGTQFSIDVEDLFGSSLQNSDFTMSATYVPVNDTFEPNNTREQAVPIALGTPIQGYAFDGYGRPNTINQTGWYDWFKVTLAAGTPTLTLSGAPATFAIEVALVDPTLLFGHAAEGSTTSTGSVTVQPATPIVAGDYWVIVSPPFSPSEAYGKGSTPAPYATMPYTLTVSN